jgi:hypothetical protein
LRGLVWASPGADRLDVGLGLRQAEALLLPDVLDGLNLPFGVENACRFQADTV